MGKNFRIMHKLYKIFLHFDAQSNDVAVFKFDRKKTV